VDDKLCVNRSAGAVRGRCALSVCDGAHKQESAAQRKDIMP